MQCVLCGHLVKLVAAEISIVHDALQYTYDKKDLLPKCPASPDTCVWETVSITTEGAP